MKSFGQFLTEEKNLHMEHAEDAIFNLGSKGIPQVLNFFNALREMLGSSSKSKMNVTVKWDGAPAVFAGTDPETDKFFVGSKSIFNKTPKLNFTPADIKRNHKGGLVDKLLVALKHLKKINIPKGKILQGDMLYSRSEIKKKTIDGESVISFQPNTITYTVPVDSDLAKQIMSSEMGIIFHTTYSGGKTVGDMSASFKMNVKELRKTKSVWFDDASFKDVSGSATLTDSENKILSGMIKNIESYSKKMNHKQLDKFIVTRDFLDMIKIYNNTKIREGQAVSDTENHIDEFTKWYEDKKREKMKDTEQNKIKLQDELKLLRGFRNDLIKIFDLHGVIVEAKTFIVRKLEKVKTIGTFVRTKDGYAVTGSEGFVAIDHKGSALKLVDRMEFSRLNFTAAKNWIKG